FYFDFTGYSHQQALIAQSISANKKSIYLHSDMYKEYNNNNKNMSRLLAIFHLYDNYDYLISVSNAINAINKKHMSKFVKNKNKYIAIENSYNATEIIEKSCQSIHNNTHDTYNLIVSNK